MSTPGNPPLPMQPQSAPGRFITNFGTLITGILNAIVSANTVNLGVNGAVGAGAGDTINGNFFALQAIGDSVIASYAADGDSGDTFDTLTIPSGMVIYGNFTQVVMTSGYIRAYNKPA